MESTENEGGNALLKTQLTRRTTLTAAAWSAPVVAMATATPAVAASPFDPQADLFVDALGGAEGRYSTGGPYSNGVVGANTDFRRAFSIQNIGAASFNGTLRVNFKFPGMWNGYGTGGGDQSAFNNWSTPDRGAFGGASIGGVSPWNITNTTSQYTQNKGTGSRLPYAWEEVWLRMDSAYVDLQTVNLPPGGEVWFGLNASIPDAWILTEGTFLNTPNQNNRIYWDSAVSITATTSTGTVLGTYDTPVGTWNEGIWYFNGDGPWAYEGNHGIYPRWRSGQ